MRSKIDPKDERRGRGRRPARRPGGGKALQRLLTYLGERDPHLVGDVVPMEVPPAARPRVGPTRRALRVRPARARRARAAPTPVASRTFAAAISRAATKMPAAQPRTIRAARSTRARH